MKHSVGRRIGQLRRRLRPLAGPAVRMALPVVLVFLLILCVQGTAKTADGWEVSYRIPLSFLRLFLPEFAFAGVLRANVYKCGDMAEREHYLSWNPVTSETPDFHRPQDFGRMMFE